GQARLMGESYQYLESLIDPAHPGSGPFIERIYWCRYRNQPTEHWGLRTRDRMTRKASYFAFRDLTPVGPEPGVPRLGELEPKWNGQSDSDLPVQVLQDDLLSGLVPEVFAGGLH